MSDQHPDNNESLQVDTEDFEVDLASVVAAAVNNIYNETSDLEDTNNNGNDDEQKNQHDNDLQTNDDNPHDGHHDGHQDLQLELDNLELETNHFHKDTDSNHYRQSHSPPPLLPQQQRQQQQQQQNQDQQDQRRVSEANDDSLQDDQDSNQAELDLNQVINDALRSTEVQLELDHDETNNAVQVEEQSSDLIEEKVEVQEQKSNQSEQLFSHDQHHDELEQTPSQQQLEEESSHEDDDGFGAVQQAINDALLSVRDAVESQMSKEQSSSVVEDIGQQNYSSETENKTEQPSQSFQQDSTSAEEERVNLEFTNVIKEALANVQVDQDKENERAGFQEELERELSKNQQSTAFNESTTTSLPSSTTVNDTAITSNDMEAADMDLHRAIEEALKDTHPEINESTNNDNDHEVTSSSRAGTEDDVFKEALSQMVQNVVETNLFPSNDNRNSNIKPTARARSKRQNNKTGGSSDIESFQWNEMMEKALEMAMDNPENLISSMNQLETDTRTSSQPTQRTARPFLGTSSVLPSGININMSSDAIKAAARERVAQIQQQLQREGKLPPGYFSTGIQSTTLEDSSNSKQNKKPSRKKTTADIIPLIQQFQRPSYGKAPNTPLSASSSTASASASASTSAATLSKPAAHSPYNIITTDSAGLNQYSNSSAFTHLSSTEVLGGAHNTFKLVDSSKSLSPLPLKIIPRNTPLINNILNVVDIRSLNSRSIAGKLDSGKIDELRGLIDSAVSLYSGSKIKYIKESDMDDEEKKERIRLENRQRKKKWRESNIERNRDNDLRARVIKRAQHLYPDPQDEEIRKEWIISEFAKRKQKRLMREHKQLYGNTPYEEKGDDSENESKESRPTSLFDALQEDDILDNIADISTSLGDKVTTEQLKSPTNTLTAISSTALSLFSAYLATNDGKWDLKLNDKRDESQMERQDSSNNPDDKSQSSIVTSLVNSLYYMFTRFEPNSGDSSSQLVHPGSPIPESDLSLMGMKKLSINSSDKSKSNNKITAKFKDSNALGLKQNPLEQFLKPPATTPTNFPFSKVIPEKRKGSATDNLNTKKVVVPRPRPAKPSPPPIPQVKLPQYLKPQSNSIKSAITSLVVKPLSSSRPSYIKPITPNSGGTNTNNNNNETKPSSGTGGFVGLRKPGAFRKPPGFGIKKGEIKKPFGGITPIKRPVAK